MYTILFILPHFNFLALNLSTTIVAVIGLAEIKELFNKKSMPYFNVTATVTGILIPVSAYFQITGAAGNNIFVIVIILSIIAVLVRSIFLKNKDNLNLILNKITNSVFIIIYPCLFLSFVIFSSSLNNPSFSVLFLICLIYFNYTAAYIFGKLFGRRLNLFISPGKSIAGFIGGISISVCTALVFYMFKPDLFRADIVIVLLFGALIGFTTITGDLIESLIKRSAGVKDSGVIMMGRGGILDSVDSVLISAPVFFFLYPYIAN
jgi:phosphatidate cytidylyltransferase